MSLIPSRLVCSCLPAVPLIVTVAVTRFAVATCEVLNVPLVAAQFTMSPAITGATEQLMFAVNSVAVPS